MAMRYLILLIGLLALVTAPAHAEKRIALTFDDVPREKGAFLTPDERTDMLIAALKKAGVEQAAFFVTTGNLETPDGAGGEARIAKYAAAGHVIANHSYSHSHLTKMTADAYLADLDRASAWLKGRAGYRPWFRFPYLNEGGSDKAKRDAVRAGLASRGLRNGYVTADGSDWNLEALTQQAAREGKAMDMKALRKLYVATQMSAVEYHERLAQMTLGRSPAHVMLLHETDLAAMFLPDFVRELRANGWTIITADEAYADPINTAMPDVPYAWGTLIGSMAWEKDIKPPAYPIWVSTDTQKYLFNTNVIQSKDDQ